MKSIFAFPILFSAFCIGSLAQTNEVTPCPSIFLTNEPSTPSLKGYISYTVVLDKNTDKSNLKYEWTVKGGEILNGQRTSTVKIKMNSDSLTVTANVRVLPQNCTRSVTESLVIDYSPHSILIDEFSIFVSRIDKAKFDNLEIELRNNPDATAYIIEKFAKKTPRKSIDRKNQLIINHLVKTNGIKRDRIVLENALADSNTTQFFIVPTGAMPPTCDNCVIIKSSNY